jgi:serine protease Do
MKISRLVPLAMAGLLTGGSALAQSSGKNVTILRMSGPQLGVRLEEVDRDVVTRLRLKEEKGAVVTDVLENSAAEKAGLRKDDVIVRFQGESVLTAAQLSRIVREVPEGRKVDIDVIRDGAPLKVTATLEKAEWSRDGMDFPEMADLSERLNEKFKEMDGPRLKMKPGIRITPRAFNFKLDEDGPRWAAFGAEGKGRLGITYTEIDGQLAHYFKSPKESAILINSVAEESPAGRAGLKAGDLLIKIDGVSVEEGSDLQEAVRDIEDGKATSVTVWRDGRSVELSVTLEEPKVTARKWRKPVS